MKVLSLFSGLGAFERALETLKIEYELIAYSEIDKYASKAYSLIHGVSENLNLGDVTKIDETKLPKDVDLITYGFPCQDISVAGKQKGFESAGVKTRSGLFFDALRIIKATRPRIAIAENVKNLTGKRFKNEFDLVLKSLEDVGYNNYWQVLNAKDFGIPQNRERVFIVSIRKDIDKNAFKFPEKIPLELKLKDLLENDVDEKYFFAEEKTKKIQSQLKNKATVLIDLCQARREKKVREYTSVAPTICGRDYKEPRCVQVGTLDIQGHDSIKRVYSSAGLCPTLTSMQGGNRQPKIVANGELCKTESGKRDALRIRKLTPTECFRLMGFSDKDVQILIENKISNSQLYKMAGNSIVVNVLVAIFKELRKDVI